MVRGIRGAITVEEDTPEAIHQATRELLLKMLEANGIQSYEELAAVIFTSPRTSPPPSPPRPRGRSACTGCPSSPPGRCRCREASPG